jgi:hypothetical protein
MKLLSIALSFGLVATATAAPGVGSNGDTCADAIPVALGANAFDSTGNTNSGFHDPSCVGRDGFVDIWFVYTAAQTGFATVNTCGSDFDTVLRVLEGPDCATLTCLAGNDDACQTSTGSAFASEVQIPVVGGQQYFIHVEGWGSGDQGVGILDISQPLLGEDCSDPIAVADGITPFDTTGYTDSGFYDGSCASRDGDGDIWFVYTAAATGNTTFETCGADFDTVLRLFEGPDCASLTCLEGNDDACELSFGTDNYASRISPFLTEGNSYLIQVEGWGLGDQGAFDLTISAPAPTPPNDECVDAIALGEGVSGPFLTGGASLVDPFACGSGGAPDIWFTYTPAVNGDFSINLCGSDYDTAMELFTGDCGALTLVECNDDFCGLQSGVSYCGIAGETYTFRVGGFNGSTGTAVVEIQNSGLDGYAITTFEGGNGLNVGGTVYFDGTFTEDCPVASIGANVQFTNVGDPVLVNVYTNPAGRTGNQNDPAGWTLLGTASGIANPIGVATVLTPDAPMTFVTGFTGIAIEYVTTGVVYTNGNGSNETAVSGDGTISLSLGESNPAAFGAGLFSPRIWNGWIQKDTSIGTEYCPQPLNSTGAVSTLVATGSDAAADNCITLTATNLPLNSFGYFICGQTQAQSPVFGGFVCIGGDIGRGVGGGILSSGSTGSMQTTATLDLPQPSGSQQVLAGETWNFQAINRDSIGGVATAALSNGISITFQ